MQFAVAHKRCTYAMLAVAFIALIGGGAVDPFTTLLGIAGLTASWWIEPPRFDVSRHQLGWTAGSVLVLLYALVLALTRGDLLGGGTTLIVFLAVAKACQRRTNRDWGQLVFLSVAMLIAASVLNTGILFAGCFAVFVITSTWAFTLLHIRSEVEANMLIAHPEASLHHAATQRILSSRRIVDRRFFVSTGLVSLAVFAATVMIFFSIPRVGVGFVSRQQTGPAMIGFSEDVKLGGHGTLKRDPSIVMRVRVDGQYQGRNAPYLRWRGAALDRYRDGQWTRSRRAPPTEAPPLSAGPAKLRRTLAGYDDQPASELLRQEIWLEPLETNVLFAASMPVSVEYDVPKDHSYQRTRETNDELRMDRREAIRYVAYSRVADPSVDRMRAAGATIAAPPTFEVYKQLPPEITKRTRDLALEIAGTAPTAYDKAIALRDWLRSEMKYSLDLKDPGSQEPIDFFLFDRKAGHCEYFASAFVIMAREVGLYARQVNGFLGGEWNEYDNYLAVRAGDAHSWAEVYLGEAGWITMDATAAASTDLLGRGSSGPLDKLRRFMDSLRFQWAKWVVDYDLSSQLGLLRDVGRAVSRGIDATKAWIRAAGTWLARHGRWLAGGALVIGLAWIALRYRGRGARGGNGQPERGGAIVEALRRAERALAKHGFIRDATATPQEFAAAIRARDPSWGTVLDPVVAHYHAAQWGHSPSHGAALSGAVEAIERESLRRLAEASATAPSK